MKRRWLWWLRSPRVDGVTAASWENGYYTRDRTDLPYPPPRLRVIR